ncbi:F0F1 ATP synthase subunit epsilon [Sanguibacter antarcticus]|uniref:ATP synthase epsilon chain n=1 Tax=Sanguibacter antarcticus TaxID=372484 RepID=A0A2A9E195_9MICO|nr:F0F1 ATP synthase subunit epsilon [Sanguibacter antarcticus]PFG32624.1 ATP synthase F1 subcomplex epsilon subunit [Sanguibacter antarcticus]
MAQLEVDLVAADRKVWSGPARQVSAPAADGEIGILQGHSPLLAVLRAGRVRITSAEGTHVEAVITGGFISVDSDTVTIVADSVEMAGAAV